MTIAVPPPAIKTTCPYCGVGCGVTARPDGLGGAAISGDADHPANFGRLCSKGSALGETLSLDDRLLAPMLRTRSGSYETVPWATALDRVADGLARTKSRHGAEAIAFYLSGQLLTEDYYVANKLAKGFIGTPHVDTNSRLCMASSVAGHRRAFGADLVPGSYEDLDQADLIVLVGSNTAWCHPVLFQRMLKNRQERGAKLIVIDPRRQATAEEADLFLPIRPGSDTVLFASLLIAIAGSAAFDADHVQAHTAGSAEALKAARDLAPDIETVAERTGLSVADIGAFQRIWIETERTVTAWSQGVNQSVAGTDKVNAIINCHLAAGRVGKPGTGPFSLTGQPNAMGGREVGGLANMLAAHMGYGEADRDRVRRFWNAPNLAAGEGFKAVQMFDAIDRSDIRALWVMATNPAVSMPDAGRVRAAIGKLHLFIVSDVLVSNDTIAQGPDVLLPAAAWGEKDGTVTNSERRISRQRAFLPLPGEARPDWWIINQVAGRLGYQSAFAHASAAAVFREHAALSAFENGGGRVFDIGGLAETGDAAYDDLAPVQWPLLMGEAKGRIRLFEAGRYATPDGKARFVAPEIRMSDEAATAEFPFLLNTGRVRDHWHTLTRTGKSPRLSQHVSEPLLAIHPDDAQSLNLPDQGFARIRSAHGEAVLRVELDAGQRRGELFAPIHWSHDNSNAALGHVVDPATDPVSGQPDLKATSICVTPVSFRYQGFRLSRVPVSAPGSGYWVRRMIAGGVCTIFATDDPGPWLEDGMDAALDDIERKVFRRIRATPSGISEITYCSAAQPFAALDALIGLFGDERIAGSGHLSVLAGVTASSAAPSGPVICACFGIRQAPIRDFIDSAPDCSVQSIGEALKAGTNCGSCQPEIRRMIAESSQQQSA